METKTYAPYLVIILIFACAIPLSISQHANAQSSSSPINTSSQFSSGDVSYGYVNMWYSWVNTQGVRLIFLALHSTDSPSPVGFIIAQEYNTTTTNKPVFVSSTPIAFEVFNDTNHNGILDANFSAGTTELRYTLLINASQTFSVSPVSKTSLSGVTHYDWNVSYGTVQAILVSAGLQGGYNAGDPITTVNIDKISAEYDYAVNANSTFLNSRYSIGQSTGNFNFSGLSLSVLFETSVVSPVDYNFYADQTPFNSISNQTLTSPISSAQLNVGNVTAYKFFFNDTYSMANPSGQQGVYTAKFEAAPLDSVPSYIASQSAESLRGMGGFMNSLPIFGDLPTGPNLNYSSSNFLYRLSFPNWSGNAISEDPTFVAYFSSINSNTLPGASSTLYDVFLVATISGFVALAFGMSVVFRRRH
jgi:hypothetical protein